MRIADLDVEVSRDGKGIRLLVRGSIYGMESRVTKDELRSLAAYLLREAEQKEEKR